MMNKGLSRAISKKHDAMRGTEIIFSASSNFIKIFIILLIVFIIIGLWPVRLLQASNYKTDKNLKNWIIKKGDSFDVRYTHSVQLVPVSEIYFIDENYRIILEETYFYSYGAGLPATTPYKFEITENNEFRIYDIKEPMDNLIYRTGAVRADHHIEIKNRSYSFLTFSEAGEGVKFTVRKSTLLKHLIGRFYNVRQKINYRK